MAEIGQSLLERPPYSNRGVYPLVNPVNTTNGKPHFDAYCATVHAHPDLILDHLEDALESSGIACKREVGPPVRFYTLNTLLIGADGHRLVQVRSGGNPHPFVECKGAQTTIVAERLRSALHHRPSRIDSAIDRAAPGLFQQLHALAKVYEAKFGLRLDYAGASIEHPDRGTTIYLGSRKSQVFVRIYQKGLQLAEQMGLVGDQITDELRNWVRIELEFKPQKTKAKKHAALVNPTELWGLSHWTHQFANEALAIEAERVNVSERRESDHHRALRFMAHQYRAHLQQLLNDHKGDYRAAMATLLELADLTPAEAA